MALRTCLGCRQVRDKKELVRFSSRSGALKTGGAAGGRGAYICRNEECLKAAMGRKDPFSRALKDKITLPGADELLERFRAEVLKINEKDRRMAGRDKNE